MKVTREQAAQNRERIIDAAAQLFRERGFEGIGVADLMKEAGLTHGGFYGHFSSKDDLIAQASARELTRSLGQWFTFAERASDDPLSAVADGNPPPLVWRHPISNRLEKERIERYGVGPFADGQSRLETELQATIPLDKLVATRALVDRLVADPRAAQKVFGKDYRVVVPQVPPGTYAYYCLPHRAYDMRGTITIK